MAVEIYIAKEGENLYDLAIHIYKDIRGLEKMVADNPHVFTSIEQEFYTGSLIFFETPYSFNTISTDSFVKKREFLEPYIVLQGQSIYDLAVQLYGDMDEGLRLLLPFIEITELGEIIPAGTIVPRKVPVNEIGIIYQNNNYLVATFQLDLQGLLAKRIHDYEFNITFN